MSKHKKKNMTQDLQYEGKDKVYMDVDRMINEGLSGGSVHRKDEFANIEEAVDFPEETPPHNSELNQ
ncbi:hypothetical protein ACQCT6_06080 [Cytobacillus gottheilii]|uniref:DUF4025 domain-containing protein n=1 Tax=Cytobacillus gottheilii TaxID=859144 RepID=A0ABX8FFG1_9BACI|nr:hypothetical protein [Cytobacillus gottheilii]QVY62766.1 hypothetical protein J1899_06875 [Cytobacillus gottheilii]